MTSISSSVYHKLDTMSQKFIFQTAKDGMAGTLIGYCVGQLSGANPLTYNLAYLSARVAQTADSLICKSMLAYGPPSAIKKAISTNISLAAGFSFFFGVLGIIGCHARRDQIISTLVENQFAHQTGALLAGYTLLLVASENLNIPLLKKIEKAAIESMHLRAKEISWDDSNEETAKTDPIKIE